MRPAGREVELSRWIELSHVIEDGMETLPGVLPRARIEPLIDREASRARYQGHAEFLLSGYHLPGNTGTYLDSPFHRHADGDDLAAITLDRVAGLPGIVVDVAAEPGPVDLDLDATDLTGSAVLVRSGWDGRWGADDYWTAGPYLSARALDRLVEGGAGLLGVDWPNVDDTTDPARPAHTRLLAAGVLVVEHLTGLSALPADGFRFFAVSPRIVGGASFPVRAFAELPGPAR
jgi:kynurenine formamidase